MSEDYEVRREICQRKTGIVDIPCFKCRKEIKDVSIVEGTQVKCPHCSHGFVINMAGLMQASRESVISVYEKLK